MEQKPQKPLNNRELSSFCEQMAMMIKAGIPVSEAVSILKESLEDPDGAAVLESVAKRLEDYGTLYEAFRDSGVFPDYMLDMVHIGEEAGRLDEVFESLSSYYERQESLARSIKSAVTYPCIMIVLMLAVILVLIIKVMPVFNQVYLQLGAQMGGFSRGILDFGVWLGRYSLVFLILAVLLAVALVLMFCTKKGRNFRLRLGRRLPFTRRILEDLSVSRFADGMAIALKSGLDSDQGLELSGRLTEDPSLKEKVQKCREMTAGGIDLGTAFKDTGIFSGLYARMIHVGILSGSLDHVMEQAASQYAEEADARISRAVSRLEPALVAVMSVLVGMILLSVMLPLMGIMSGIG